MTPLPLTEPIPHVCTIKDVCRILQMCESQFFALRRKGTFPIPEIQPALDSTVRFRGADVQAYIDGRRIRSRRLRRPAA